MYMCHVLYIIYMERCSVMTDRIKSSPAVVKYVYTASLLSFKYIYNYYFLNAYNIQM